MKKWFVLSMFTLFMGSVLVSCEKCVECDFSGLTGITLDNEFCSKDKDERNAYETACKAVGGKVK